MLAQHHPSPFQILSLDNLCDTLHYISHSTLQKCCLVCWEWNAFIARYPKTFKQRPHFRCLRIVPSWVTDYKPFDCFDLGRKKEEDEEGRGRST